MFNAVSYTHLDITMICEGVETEAQVAIMKSVSCNIAQGFYYCQPLRRPQFENLLNLSKIEIVNAERRSINGYGRTVKLPSYRDLGDLFPQMYDFAIELNLKDGRYSRMAFNPTGNVFIPYTGDYKNDYKHIVQELLYPEDIEKFTAQLDFDVLSANYNNTCLLYTSTFYPEEMRITYCQTEGDLKKMEGEWRLVPVSEGTEVSLLVDFEFGIPMIAGLLNPILKKKVRENSENMLTAVKAQIEK